MTTTTTPTGGIQVLRIEGALLVGNRQATKDRVIELLNGGARAIVLDFAKAEYIDATGLGLLISIRKHAHEHGALLVLAGMNSDLRELLEITRIADSFTMADTAAIAVAALESGAA